MNDSVACIVNVICDRQGGPDCWHSASVGSAALVHQGGLSRTEIEAFLAGLKKLGWLYEPPRTLCPACIAAGAVYCGGCNRAFPAGLLKRVPKRETTPGRAPRSWDLCPECRAEISPPRHQGHQGNHDVHGEEKTE
jgi:hypothetical protein